MYKLLVYKTIKTSINPMNRSRCHNFCIYSQHGYKHEYIFISYTMLYSSIVALDRKHFQRGRRGISRIQHTDLF